MLFLDHYDAIYRSLGQFGIRAWNEKEEKKLINFTVAYLSISVFILCFDIFFVYAVRLWMGKCQVKSTNSYLFLACYVKKMFKLLISSLIQQYGLEWNTSREINCLQLCRRIYNIKNANDDSKILNIKIYDDDDDNDDDLFVYRHVYINTGRFTNYKMKPIFTVFQHQVRM